MLGWKAAISVYKNSKFGPGTGPIWLDGLKCLGKEDTVTKCRHDQWGSTNCDHSEDLGISCSNVRMEEKVNR